MLCNKTMELHNHALMYAHVNTQLVETKKTCLYSFFFHSIKIYWATLNLQERHGDSLEAEWPLRCQRRASSVPPNPSGQTSSCLSISPGPTCPRMVWNTAYSPVTQPACWFQGCISPLDWWEGCQCFAPGSKSSCLFESLFCDGLLSGCNPHSSQSLGHWTSCYWLCSRGCSAESCQDRPFGALGFHLCWALLLQLSWCGHLQSCGYAVETLTF